MKAVCVSVLLALVTLAGCKKEPERRMRIKKIERLPDPKPRRPARPADPVKHDPDHVLGGEQGLDHVGVAVKDLAGARAAYTALGFGNPQEGRLPNGIDNVNFYFGDTTYLELLTCYDRKKNPWIASFIDGHEKGAMFLMLCVFTYTHTANFLRAKGFKVGPPRRGAIRTKGMKQRRPRRGKAPTWLTFSVDGQRLPGNTTFIAYTRRLRRFMLTKLRDEKLRRAKFSHPNTVLGLRSAWIAVKDLAAAQKQLEAVGLGAGARREVPQLKAAGVEIQAGQGTLLLLRPTGKGPAADFLRRREGIIGLGFEVERLDTAREHIAKHAGIALAPHDGVGGRAILVPAEKAFGVYLELFQRAEGKRR